MNFAVTSLFGRSPATTRGSYHYFRRDWSKAVVKWEATSVIALLVGISGWCKVWIDSFNASKDRKSKEETTEHQIESTDRIDLTKMFKEGMDSMRQDVMIVKKESEDNKKSWLEQARETVRLEKELGIAHVRIEALTEECKILKEGRETSKATISMQHQEIESLRSQVLQLQSDKLSLERRLNNMETQVNQNSEAIMVESLPVGTPEMIMLDMMQARRADQENTDFSDQGGNRD